MERSKILLLGSQGLIGVNLANMLRQENNVFSTYHKRKNDDQSLELDILSADSIKKTFDTAKPDIVINLCAVYNNLQFCENNKELVMAVNGTSLKAISDNANNHSAFLMHFSTDYVFDGKHGNYKEGDNVSPVNYYGISKAEGEKNVMETAKNYCIVRASMVYGNNEIKKTLPEWILDGIKSSSKLEVIYDQYMTPTYLQNLCNMVMEVIQHRYQGIIHLAGKDRLSRYDFAIKLIDLLSLPTTNLVRVKSSDIPGNENRPPDSSLNTDLASSLLHVKPERIEQSLEKYVKSMSKSGHNVATQY